MLEMAIPDPQDAVCGLVYVSWCPHAMNLNKNIDRHRGGGLCPFVRKSGGSCTDDIKCDTAVLSSS